MTIDVSAAAGIYGGADGFGLGLVVSDFDLDGSPEVVIISSGFRRVQTSATSPHAG